METDFTTQTTIPKLLVIQQIKIQPDVFSFEDSNNIAIISFQITF